MNKEENKFLKKEFKNIEASLRGSEKDMTRTFWRSFVPFDALFILITSIGFIYEVFVFHNDYTIGRVFVLLTVGFGAGSAMAQLMGDIRWFKKMKRDYRCMFKRIDIMKKDMRKRAKAEKKAEKKKEKK